jgi:dTMP kinase
MNGCFIVIEGPDGSGTTTHAALLAQRLRDDGFDVLETAEPSNGAIGTFIRGELHRGAIPSDALQMLFSADRAWHVAETILPALNKGKIIVCDRYIASTLIYGEALDLDQSWLESMNKNFIQPSIELLALPSFEVCAERLGLRKTKDMLEGRTLQKKVYDGYVSYAKQHSVVSIVDTGVERQTASDAFYALAKAALPQR